MTASKLPVGLPYPNPTKSYWRTPTLPIDDHRSTAKLPTSAQYVIVGSGITGALIARKLREQEPSANIVMLEARQTCSGATGRNGGHCRTGRWLNFKHDVDKYGQDEAIRLDRLEEVSVANIAKIIRDENIDCDFREVETVDLFTDLPKWIDAMENHEARRKAVEEQGEDSILSLKTVYKIWNAPDSRKAFLIPEAVGAVTYTAYCLSAYKFVCALLEQSVAKGLNLQTTTPVTRVFLEGHGDSKPKWNVCTERGTIVADKVILATNAYTSALYPPLSDFIIPTRGQLAVVRPGSNIAGNPALKRTVGFYSAISGDYYQCRVRGQSGEGDVIAGGGRRLARGGEHSILDDSTIHPVVSEYLTHIVGRYFGKENWGEDGKVLQEWTGIMGYTKDGQGIIGEAPGQEGLWICAGFNGHGMALTFQSAEALVQLLLGKDEVDMWLPKAYRLSRVSHQ